MTYWKEKEIIYCASHQMFCGLPIFPRDFAFRAALNDHVFHKEKPGELHPRPSSPYLRSQGLGLAAPAAAAADEATTVSVLVPPVTGKYLMEF